MEIQIVEREEIKVVGISWTGSYSQASSIPKLFIEMEKRLPEVPNRKEEPVLLAPFHSRETEFTYYVTTPVDGLDQIPEGMVGFTIPSKNYVVATHTGSSADVQDTYLRMFAWMKEYGYDQDYHALSLEVYKEEHKEQNAAGDLHFQIYLPVKSYKV